MKLSIHIPIISYHHQDTPLGNRRTGSNPPALMLSHEAALHYLIQHVKACQTHDGLSYRIARYDLLEELACFTYTGQTHYQLVWVDGDTRLVKIVMN
ncbi:hypothetical protein [Budvicia aquatica]|uniref:Uncharacterized protein n=1 Tax=Budvicia aquatica TaxID=82979 RepID=A0A2C6CZA6_9GAMM|nr:hypothetical protein [Budvicia aquatica]PHI32019.1 hypothetical protein CRN84_23200 [Budvicia aquatica]